MNGGSLAIQKAITDNPVLSEQLAGEVNSFRVGVVANKLAMSAQKDDPQKFFHLCLSLARGIDYGVANKEPPGQASNLTPILKQVCCRKEFYLLSGIMVLMVSVKNACKLGWFSPAETEELLALADEVGSCFRTMTDINSETSVLMPTLSSVMSRYYPSYKLGHVIMSLEMKPGYGAYLQDFHITKDLSMRKDERLRLLVVAKDNVETSSCIISPQQVNILINGRPVDKRTNVKMDLGPQLPTIVNQLLKYGTNLLQAVGQSNGNYIVVIAAMSTRQTSDLTPPQDYVQPDTILSGPDSEVIEGASRISLNCPISYKRIKTPAKGHMCKHYQCFDFGNYVEINSKRPSWRCPHCNQSVGFTDLRVDRMMVKILEEVGEDVYEVTIDADGSWKVASSGSKDDSHDKTTIKQGDYEAEECIGKSDGQCNVFDLTGDDHEMDTDDGQEYVDTKPVIHHNLPGQSVFPNSASPSTPRNMNGLFQYPLLQPQNGISSGTASYNMRSEALTNAAISGGNFGIVPVQTDSVTPSLNRQPNNFQGTSFPMSSIGVSQLSHADSLQLQEVFHGRSIPRNAPRTPSAIQALPVQMPTPSPQQHTRPIMSLPGPSGSSAPFQMPHASTQQVASNVNISAERQRQSHINALLSSIPTTLQNRAVPQGVGMTAPSYPWVHQPLSQPPHLMRPSQKLSQPPHLMRSSQLPRHNPQQQVVPTGASPNPSPITVQRVHLAPSQASQLRQQHTISPQPHLSRSTSSVPLNSGTVPLAVSRTENLIDIQQVEQTWRPTGRMRGALTGQAYSAALSQHMSPGTTPTARPPVTDSNNQILLANRMAAHAIQMPNRSPFNAAGNNIGPSGTQGDGSRGGK